MATLDGRSAPARANAMAVAKVAASCGEAASGVPSLVREPATCAVDADSVPLQTAAPAAAPGRALAAFAMAVDGDAAPMITSMLPAAARAALAPSDAVPSLDIPKTCRETGEAAMRLIPGSGDAVDACLRSEQSAREQMAKDWAGYSSSDKARCIRPAAYLPSYAEWLTCLEMEREVRKMRAERTVPAPQRQ